MQATRIIGKLVLEFMSNCTDILREFIARRTTGASLIQIIRVLALRIVRRKFDLNVSYVDVGIIYHKEAVSPFAYCFDGLEFSLTTFNPRAHLLIFIGYLILPCAIVLGRL